VALRIEDEVVRGEIDNTVEGKTTGWIWLLGRTEPVLLDLDGDCWRDLAGARLRFRNPLPAGSSGLGLAGVQKGVVGDMTASRKNRVPDCPADEFHTRRQAGGEVPTVWKNCLYLEWFSEANGRVVVETTDFELELGARDWQMDRDAEEAQKMANLQAMRDFLNGMIRRRPPSGSEGRVKDDEFEWEQRLQESDRLTDAYQEVLEKYMDDPDAERKQAFAMGWDGLLDAMAAEAEGKPVEMPEWKREALEAAQEGLDEESWKDDEEDDDPFRQHPLQAEAQELALRAFDLVQEDAEEAGDAAELTHLAMQVATKLAGALNGTYEMEAGYVLAILKRCLVWQADALAACGRLVEVERDADRERALEALRDEMFALRDQMVDLRRELKGC